MMVKKKQSKKHVENYEKPLAIAGTYSNVIKGGLVRKTSKEGK
jgi:hypothetical protein